MIETIKRYVPLVLIVVAWEVIARLHLFNLLPAPSAVAVSWFQLLREGDLLTNGLDSLYRLVAGLALAIVLGGAIGIAMAWWRGIHFLLNPIVELLYPLPKSALIPVTAIWLGLRYAAPPRMKRLFASVPPEVNTTCVGCTFTSAPTCSRARSMALRATVPSS